MLDPEALVKELNTLATSGISVNPKNFGISLNCSIITKYHQILDHAREGQGPVKIGTTGKGIGPAYEDKIARKGLTFDLLIKSIISKSRKISSREVIFI